MDKIEFIKKEFPIFEKNKELVFLDNASTTQKPRVVLDKLLEVYTTYNSNVHRGLYKIAIEADIQYEMARKKIANLINAEPEEIIFTSGTTDSINLLADSLVRSKIIPHNPSIITSELDHHSNILPWKKIINGNLNFNLNKASAFNYQFDLVAYSIISNVTGRYTNIEDLKEIENYKNAIFVADAAQAVAHMPIDVKEMDVDFLTFSGHKMFGPFGIGVLYGKSDLLKRMEPFKLGGGMIRDVTKTYSSWAPPPYRFEAGTPPIADAIALGTSVDFIEGLGLNNISVYEKKLKDYSLELLRNNNEIKIYHDSNDKAGAVISFTIDGVHPHDIAQFLGDRNICVRAGHHCTQIYHKEVLKIPASLRLSLSVYNTKEDIDRFVDELASSIKYYKK